MESHPMCRSSSVTCERPYWFRKQANRSFRGMPGLSCIGLLSTLSSHHPSRQESVLAGLPFGAEDAHHQGIYVLTIYVVILTQPSLFDEATGPIGANGALVGGIRVQEHLPV